MFKPVRVVATIVFLVSIGLVFVGAYAIGSDVRRVRYITHFRLLTRLPFQTLCISQSSHLNDGLSPLTNHAFSSQSSYASST